MFHKIFPKVLNSAKRKFLHESDGDSKILKADEHEKMHYSQDGEDVVLSSFYEGVPDYKGFYVDIGALHPLRFSNTHLFYKKGWRGINIDATPGSMKEFRKFRPNDINLEAGISRDEKELTFYRFKEAALNSFEPVLSEERIRKGWELLEKVKVKTASINEVLSVHLPIGQKIDFMSIDIEGLDFEVVKSLDWSKYHPDFLLVEELSIRDKDIIGFEYSDLYQFLREKGYSIVARTRRTLIFRLLNEDRLNGDKFLKVVDRLADEYALKKTIIEGRCVDKDGNPVPWYTYPAIEYIRQLDFSDKRIFEFGSGNSTLYWSGIAKSVVSVEDDKVWHDANLASKKKNAKMIYAPIGEEYPASILREDGEFDVIIVDGKMRDKCCEVALRKIKQGGCIILDNSERAAEFDEYARAVKTLKDARLIQVDFCGFGPINDYTWATSFFFTREFDFKSKQHPIQPANITGSMYL